MMLFCSRLMRPRTASSRKDILVDRNARVIGQRLHVPERRLEPPALILRQRDGSGLLHVHQQPLKADQAFARLRDQVAIDADALDHAVQVPAGGGRAVGSRKDQQRHRVEVELHALEQVGGALGERLEQPGEQRRRGRARCRRPLDQGHEPPERCRIRVAVGDQPVVGEDEGDRAALRRWPVELGADGRRHVDRSVLFVETARGLDLLHLVAGGYIHREQRLDGLFLLRRRLEQVGPQEFVGKWCRRDVFDPGVTASGGNQETQHAGRPVIMGGFLAHLRSNASAGGSFAGRQIVHDVE